MAETPTITIDVTVLLEKLQQQLAEAERMVAASAGRMQSSMRGGGGVGIGGGGMGSSSAVMAPPPPPSFVASSAAARAGVIGGAAGGGFAAGAAGGAVAGRLGQTAFRRMIGPAAIIAAALDAGRQINTALDASETGGSFFESLASQNEGRARNVLRFGAGIPGFFATRSLRTALSTREREIEERARIAPIAEAVRNEISSLDFARRLGVAERMGDDATARDMVIENTVTKTLQEANALRAAGIAPELVERRNRAIAESLAEELGGSMMGGVDQFETAAGTFRVGSAGGIERTNDLLQRIIELMERQSEGFNQSDLLGSVQTGSIG